jgi:hypothetical protein
VISSTTGLTTPVASINGTLSLVNQGGLVDISGVLEAHGTYNVFTHSTVNQLASGIVGYASFADNDTFVGSSNVDHYNGFQATPHYGATGTLGGYWSLFYAQPYQTAGLVPVLNQIVVYDTIQTGGSITTQTGLRIKNLAAGSTNIAIQTEGGTPVIFGGYLAVSAPLPWTYITSQNLHYKSDTTKQEMVFLGSNDSYPSGGPFGLSISVQGASTSANRSVFLQTVEEALSNSGKLVLQPSGGTVLIPQYASGSGTRFVCIGTDGTLTSSASGCSGT